MSGTILVTDTLFIGPEHIQALNQAGYEVARLEESSATEEELIANIPGKVGYILGGTEKVTPAVIQAADQLKAIVFTGTDWQHFIPGYDHATEKGIVIANAPGANAYAVAEYTVMLILLMIRRGLELGSTGTTKFQTTGSIQDARVGLIGMGRISELVARMLIGMGATDVVYWSRQAKPQLAAELGIKFVPLEDLVKTADVISTHTPESAGEILSQELLTQTKPGVVLINTGNKVTYSPDGLYDLLYNQTARAAFDFPLDDPRFDELTADVWFYSNGSTAYNTWEANKIASDMATQSMLNLLTTGNDDYRVN